MDALFTLAQALGLSFASGVSVYGTVALLGLAERAGWIGPLPGALGVVDSWWIIALALTLYAIEFTATLIPGVASLWEAVHGAIRPPAAAALAVLTAWNGEPALIVGAALLGGSLALGTHATKLGLRVAVDTSPEPVTNGILNTAELGVIASIAYFVWNHPYITLSIALVGLVLTLLLVRAAWRAIGRLFRGEARAEAS